MRDGFNEIVDIIDVVWERINYLKNLESRVNEFAKEIATIVLYEAHFELSY